MGLGWSQTHGSRKKEKKATYVMVGSLESKFYQCDFCDYRTTVKSRLLLHNYSILERSPTSVTFVNIKPQYGTTYVNTILSILERSLTSVTTVNIDQTDGAI